MQQIDQLVLKEYMLLQFSGLTTFICNIFFSFLSITVHVLLVLALVCELAPITQQHACCYFFVSLFAFFHLCISPHYHVTLQISIFKIKADKNEFHVIKIKKWVFIVKTTILNLFIRFQSMYINRCSIHLFYISLPI